jgi:hypothetical protein
VMQSLARGNVQPGCDRDKPTFTSRYSHNIQHQRLKLLLRGIPRVCWRVRCDGGDGGERASLDGPSIQWRGERSGLPIRRVDLGHLPRYDEQNNNMLQTYEHARRERYINKLSATGVDMGVDESESCGETAKRGTIRHRHNPYSSIGLAEIIQVRRSREENRREDPTTFWGNGEWLWLGKNRHDRQKT